jgi:hypothetical protein
LVKIEKGIFVQDIYKETILVILRKVRIWERGKRRRRRRGDVFCYSLVQVRV